MQELEAQKQDAQDRLDEMDQQKAKLKDMLNDVRQKCQEETQVVSVCLSLRTSSMLCLLLKEVAFISQISFFCV